MRDLVVIAVDDLFNVWNYQRQFGVALQTPNLDRLAAMGVSFTNAQATTPLCSPSRAAALTGQSAFTTGVVTNKDAPRWHTDVDLAATLPAVLQAAGYETHGFGKLFHENPLPEGVASQLFDSYFSAPLGTYRPAVNGRFSVGTYGGAEKDLGDFITTKAAVDLLRDYESDQPLSLMVGLKDPHVPLVSTQDYKDLYPLERIVVPEWLGDEPPAWMREFTRNGLWDTIVESGWGRLYIQGYFANISEMDARLGEILDAIEASGRDPVIAFWSDHGYMVGDHDLVGKFTPYEEATGAPLIFVDPESGARGVRHDGVVSLLDMMPTILDLVGVPIPETVEGHSLASVVSDPREPTDGFALTAIMGSISMRTPRFRITRYEDNTYELFDCRRDPAEAHNLVDVPRYDNVLTKLQNWLQAEAEDRGVTFFDRAKVVRFDATWGQQYFFSADTSDILSIDDEGGYDRGHSNNPVVRMPGWMEDFWFTAADANNAGRVYGNRLDNQIFGSGPGGYPPGGDDLLAGAGGSDRISGGPGDDTLMGGPGEDVLIGGDGNDSLRGGPGADVLDGGRGRDLASYWTSGSSVVADLRSRLQNTGEAAGDTYVNIQNLQGSKHDDHLGGDRGRNELSGGPGDDLLEGRHGNDTLAGGTGSDTLTGGTEDDELIGGPGKDLFVLGPHFGHDVIADFRPGTDRLDLRDLAFESVSDALDAFTANDGDAALHVRGDVLVLSGVDVGDLQAGDLLL
ncbi:sulfatase-like hydrolase/transferase [Acuticoccus sediminis]|uniref:sulfatase-like hydrolase/transferase n=1 Tax=Acuticoccus sediminis TaxID=2184697 RepID=UPI001CFCABD2|nr:sulfatase-like hydrolase/transferase [Acuticoccus sediminis]